jgi:hypothetical protein
MRLNLLLGQPASKVTPLIVVFMKQKYTIFLSLKE